MRDDDRHRQEDRGIAGEDRQEDRVGRDAGRAAPGRPEDHGGQVDEQGKQIEQLGQSAKDALARAQEAGVLAKGKIVFQQSFAEDRVRFKVSSFELTKEAKAALDEFAAKVKALDKGVYLEIQGHTDDTGGADYNDQLGQQRAEAVRRYLAREHKLPLGRMSTISYGDTLPVETQQDGEGPLQEPPRRDRRPRVETEEKDRKILQRALGPADFLEGCVRASSAAAARAGPTHTF